METVLITGANGFVGNHLSEELSEHGYKVSGVGGSIGSSKKSPHLTDYTVLDLSDKDQASKLDLTNVGSIVHLAGLAAVGPSFDNPMSYININMGIEINLFETALAQKARPKFLIISSGGVYSVNSQMPLRESSAVEPNSPYSVSKLGQEQIATYYKGRGFETLVVRPFNHIGPGQNLGFIASDLAKQLAEIENGAKNELLVGNLDVKRDYTDVRDIVRAYRLLLEKGVPGELYNVCSGKPYSGHEILDGLARFSKIKPNIVLDSARMRPYDSPMIYGSNNKINKHTGWKPSIKITDTLKDVINDWRGKVKLT